MDLECIDDDEYVDEKCYTFRIQKYPKGDWGFDFYNAYDDDVVARFEKGSEGSEILKKEFYKYINKYPDTIDSNDEVDEDGEVVEYEMVNTTDRDEMLPVLFSLEPLLEEEDKIKLRSIWKRPVFNSFYRKLKIKVAFQK